MEAELVVECCAKSSFRWIVLEVVVPVGGGRSEEGTCRRWWKGTGVCVRRGSLGTIFGWIRFVLRLIF